MNKIYIKIKQIKFILKMNLYINKFNFFYFIKNLY